MATVWIPSLLRPLTGGHDQVVVSGRTLSEVIAALDAAYPGIGARLRDEDDLNSSLAAWVDGRVARRGLQEPLGEGSEVQFLPAVGGG